MSASNLYGKLRISLAGAGTQEYPLTQSVTTVGRAPDNNLLLDDPKISRYHARIVCESGTCSIVDLGSSNGTEVNGVRLSARSPLLLNDGDVIKIGRFELSFHKAATGEQYAGAASRDETVAFSPSDLPRLVISTPAWTREFPLDRDVLTIGRDPDSDIVIDQAVVSRRHAELRRKDTHCEIVDLGSTNGLVSDGQRISSRPLTDGDVLHITDAVSLTFKSTPGIRPVAAEPPLRTREVDLRGRDVVTIGRDQSNTTALDHPQVSRFHARLTRRGTTYMVEDLGSTNGTFVNGERVKGARRLDEGDTIRVGPYKLVFSAGIIQQFDEEGNLRLDALHLSKVVGKGIKILRDISLSIQPGEFVALVGVSGAGKSTLLDALNGFRPATGGAVLVNGVDLYQNFDAYRTELGYVPQDDIIHRELTVYKALDYAAQLRMTADTTPAERHQRIMEVLDELDLAERRDVPIHRLSGGQRKRVSIGVELLTKPSLFFLDEATSGLDPGTEAQMMRLLRKLADQGRTIILITHATKNVMICDKVIFLAKGGRLAYYGPPEEALEYFSVQEFDQIYERLESERSPEEWESRYRQSTQYRQFVASRLKNVVSRVRGAQAGLDGRRVGQQSPGSAVKRVSALRQFRVLSARYLNIMRQDRRNLLLLLLLAPILGVSDFITWKRDTFDLVTGDASQAVTMFFIMAIVTILLGCIISVREIVKEVPIYRRERMVSLKLVPYVLSKVWIGFVLAAYSAAILLIIKLLAVDFSHLGAADLGKIYVPLALSTMSGVLWGLFISAVSPSEERAMLLIILVLTPQFVFAGGMLPVSELGAPGQALGLVTTSKWALTGMVTAAKVKSGICDGPDLSQCEVPGLQGYPTDAVRANVLQTLDDQYGDIFNADPLVAWSALILLMVGLFLLILIFQKRRDAV